MAAEKIAISLPAGTLQRLEAVRQRLGKSRSSVVVEAIEAWLDESEPADDDRRYVEAYLQHPETSEPSGAVATAVVSGWEPWE
jgi:metal-responsive CopG/Arc/MetJ family transcriptional regulator